MTTFSDILYGEIELPEWLIPFTKAPEFLRLRGVRLSNVDSIQFKDFNGPTRWDHSIAVAWLALLCASARCLDQKDTAHLAIAALFHDVATPPFAHTMESVVVGFSHEQEAYRILLNRQSASCEKTFPIFASQAPQFERLCDVASRKLGINIDPEVIAQAILGGGELGFLINGTLDLDNIDNVTRACKYMGFKVDSTIPVELARWLAKQSHAPLELDSIDFQPVSSWIRYRTKIYKAFYESRDDELGREALLQHLFRRAFDSGIPRQSLLWNTDSDVISLIARSACDHDPGLPQLVQHYQLMESPTKIAEVAITDRDAMRALANPSAASHIEQTWRSDSFEPFVIISQKRYPSSDCSELFGTEFGRVKMFKFGTFPKLAQLPDWVRSGIDPRSSEVNIRRDINFAFSRQLTDIATTRPWSVSRAVPKPSADAALAAAGDWGFRMSKNETFHPYPSTFVHAIPASLISALGLEGGTILDPFGGTGQTAIEAVKAGGFGISCDTNSLATMIAKVRTTYLSDRMRAKIREITEEQISATDFSEVPNFPLVEKWHHPDTLIELSRIKSLFEMEQNAAVKNMLKAAFSAILTSSTARKGKEHGFFADNTPLPSGMKNPPYQNAVQLFVAKLNRNLDLLEKLYASFERQGKDPKQELARATIRQHDARGLDLSIIGRGSARVDAVITSPPYLCMTDYALGQRLSYQWLFSDRLDKDFSMEIGARRLRFSTKTAHPNYLKDYQSFADVMSKVIRPGGYLCTVLGAPVAKAFADLPIIEETDERLASAGFKPLWSVFRGIQWHRNHGYQRLRRERVAVHVLVG